MALVSPTLLLLECLYLWPFYIAKDWKVIDRGSACRWTASSGGLSIVVAIFNVGCVIFFSQGMKTCFDPVEWWFTSIVDRIDDTELERCPQTRSILHCAGERFDIKMNLSEETALCANSRRWSCLVLLENTFERYRKIWAADYCHAKVWKRVLHYCALTLSVAMWQLGT